MRGLILSVTLLGFVLWAADWPTESGSPQRDGWAKSETTFTKDNVKGLELLYKYKADNQAKGQFALTTPLINTRIITYLGFKEELVFGGSSDNVYAVDADLNRIIWKTHLPYKADKPPASSTALCPGGLTAPVIMNGSSTLAIARGGAGRAGRGLAGRGGLGRGEMIGPGRAAGMPRPANRSGEYYAVGSDGRLHTLNTSTGADRVEPVRFLPPNSKVGAMNIADSAIYAATLDNCGGNPNTLYAIDLASDDKKVVTFAGNVAGTAVGTDGTIYTQTHDAVFALAPKTLEVKDQFPLASSAASVPVVFQWKGRDVIAAAGNDHVVLLDSKALHTPISQAPGVFHGGFASWEDADSQTRWIYAITNKNVVGFKLDNDKIEKVWTSPEMNEPAPVVTANGLVFALSTAGRATLHVLDGATGAELYSSGNIASTYTRNSGLAVANKRIYFTTHDNTVYCFGFLAEQPQLTGK
ncbi:MAG TPA: hypothetical protein VHB50_07640 [Bryobacteraceae bacterium]|nr:hypothetical protein [Bryobacteraceae bacterium]